MNVCVCVPFKVMFSVIQSVKIHTLHTAEISYEQKKSDVETFEHVNLCSSSGIQVHIYLYLYAVVQYFIP